MFALTKLYYICPLSSISRNEQGAVSARFKDGKFYEADIVTTHASLNVLEKLKHSLCRRIPRVVLSRCDVYTPAKFQGNYHEEDFVVDIAKDITELKIPVEEISIMDEDEEDSVFDIPEDLTELDVAKREVSFKEESAENSLSNVAKDTFELKITAEEISIKDEDEEGSVFGILENIAKLNNPREEVSIKDEDEENSVFDFPKDTSTLKISVEEISTKDEDEEDPVLDIPEDIAKLEISAEEVSIKDEQNTSVEDLYIDNDIDMKNLSSAEASNAEVTVNESCESDFNADALDSSKLAKEESIIENDILLGGTLSDIEDPYAPSSDEDDRSYFPDNTEFSSSEEEKCEPVSSKIQSFQKEIVSLEPSSSNAQNNRINPEREKSLSSCAKKRRLARQKSACLFCKKLFTRSDRHLKTSHVKHPRVVAIMALTDAKERRQEFAKLRREGTFQHNNKVLAEKKGYFIVPRRDRTKTDGEYLPCINCKQYYKATSLWQHKYRCNPDCYRYGRVKAFAALALPGVVPTSTCKGNGYEVLTNLIWPVMKNDAVTEIVRNDLLIMKWGASYCSLHPVQEKRLYSRDVSQKMRLLARVVEEFRTRFGNECALTDALHPNNFNDLIEAVKNLCGQGENGTPKKPSVAKTLGYILVNCAIILRNEGITEDNKDKTCNAKRFLDLYGTEWMTRLDIKTQKEAKQQNYVKGDVKLLPVADHMITYHKYLFSEEARLVQQITAEGFMPQTWYALNKILISSVLLFNSVGAEYVERIPLSAYVERTTVEKSTDMSEVDKIISARYVYLHRFGDKHKIVILKSQIPSYDLILKLRCEAGVAPKNQYLFGKGSLYFDANYALRYTAISSGVQNHRLLTASRKYITLMAQVLNFKDEDFEILATCIGHNMNDHRHFYRIPENGLHLSKLAQMFITLCNGTLDAIKGKSLDKLPAPSMESTLQYLTTPLVAPADGMIQNDSVDTTEANNRKTRVELPLSVVPKKIKEMKPPVPWTPHQKEIVLKHFAGHIQENRVPQKADCVSCKICDLSLANRSWRNIKDFVRNAIVAKNRIKDISTKEPVITRGKKRCATSAFHSEDDDECSINAKPVRWSPEQRTAVLEYFADHIESDRVPQKADCENCKASEPALSNRSWRNIKDFVRNAIVLKNKNKK